MNLEDATKVWHVITFEEHSMARSARSLLYGLAFESFRLCLYGTQRLKVQPFTSMAGCARSTRYGLKFESFRVYVCGTQCALRALGFRVWKFYSLFYCMQRAQRGLNFRVSKF